MPALDAELHQPWHRGPDDMLTSCPKCHHKFSQSPSSCIKPTSLDLSPTFHPSTACTMTVSARPCVRTQTTRPTDHNTIAASHRSRSSCRSPKLSPSTPISFDLPPAATPEVTLPDYPQPARISDLDGLSANWEELHKSGWFYDGLTWQESSATLASTAPGTFLVRNSSHPRFLFSLSVQSKRGPTSVRLHYDNGHFRLDADPKLVPAMPVFLSVISLVEYYVSVTVKPRDDKQVWIDCTGKAYSDILLTRPLYHRGWFPSLKHLARLAINRVADVSTLDLPKTLQDYLVEYPHVL